MINLIPIEEKRKNKRESYSRILVVFFITLMFLVIILIIIILPTYFVSYEKKISTNKKLEIQKSDKTLEVNDESLLTIKALNSRLSLLEKARQNDFLFSQKILDKILSKKIPGIKIDRIFYENNSLKEKKISINGIAKNREILILFRKAFEEDVSFKNVDLPISNFVKGSDIDFSLNLISI
jgi:hypothetical protein